MRKYPMALDAAPQNGRWLDDPAAMKTALMFLLSKLPPDQLAELDTHMTEGTTPQANDHRILTGKLKDELLLYTPRVRRTMVGGFDNARCSVGRDDIGRARRHPREALSE